ncbi:hypothetical protein [Lentzea sp. NPDC092896]|uniref:hypothetical protein n=1 Tax=Lentzea sp. NPDC092896 TaxID=3364127 RepID=UPI0038132074
MGTSSQPSTFVPARRVHLVGSLPQPLCADPTTALRWQLDTVGAASLRSLVWEPDPNWIRDYVLGLTSARCLQVRRGGNYADYTDPRYYRVRRGFELDAQELALGREHALAEAMAVREQLLFEYTPDLLPPQQVGVPHALDLALFTLGNPAAVVHWMRVFQTVVAREVSACAYKWGTDFEVQLESPAILALLHRAPAWARPALARRLARQVVDLLAEAPHSIRWVVHLCYGDLDHKPLFQPRNLAPVVLFANALADWCDRREVRVPLIHFPMAVGEDPPSQDVEFYRPLRRLHRDVGVIAGLVAEHHREETVAVLSLVEALLGGPVTAIAAACGLGRRPADAAIANTVVARDIAVMWGLDAVSSG